MEFGVHESFQSPCLPSCWPFPGAEQQCSNISLGCYTESCGKLQSLLQHYKLSYSICCGDGAHAHTLDPQGLSAPSTQVNFAPWCWTNENPSCPETKQHRDALQRAVLTKAGCWWSSQREGPGQEASGESTWGDVPMWGIRLYTKRLVLLLLFSK